jgi:D-glycero-D-manno-heptose 1,7-bisphosphate phosphatase
MIQPIVYNFKKFKRKNTIFLDRDGILNDVVIRKGNISSPRKINEIVLCSDIAFFSEENITSDWNLVMITNQPDVSRGYINIKFLEMLNKMILKLVPLNAAYICPHLKTDYCECRKPFPGLINKFEYDNPQVDGKKIFIGDQLSDLNCAKIKCIEFFLKLTDYNKSLSRFSPNTLSDLYDLNGKI